MAVETVIILKDDLTGKPGDDVQTVAFSYKGTAYELELSEASEKSLAEALDPFIKVARKPGRTVARAASSGSSTTSASRAEGRAARTWAQGDGKATVEKAGVKIPGDRGRVDARIVSLWEDAGKPGL